jgi:hypothetical protein
MDKVGLHPHLANDLCSERKEKAGSLVQTSAEQHREGSPRCRVGALAAPQLRHRGYRARELCQVSWFLWKGSLDSLSGGLSFLRLD